jgi:hypothetical protein
VFPGGTIIKGQVDGPGLVNQSANTDPVDASQSDLPKILKANAPRCFQKNFRSHLVSKADRLTELTD